MRGTFKGDFCPDYAHNTSNGQSLDINDNNKLPAEL